MVKYILILGLIGFIGIFVLDVVLVYFEYFKIVGLIVNYNIDFFE